MTNDGDVMMMMMMAVETDKTRMKNRQNECIETRSVDVNNRNVNKNVNKAIKAILIPADWIRNARFNHFSSDFSIFIRVEKKELSINFQYVTD